MVKKKNDENVFCALVHLLVYVVPIFGAMVIWLLEKDKKTELRFQAKQAALYQTFGALGLSLIGILGVLFSVVFGVVTFGVGFVVLPMLLFVLTILGVVYVSYPLYAAYECYQGKHFKYWVLGDKV